MKVLIVNGSSHVNGTTMQAIKEVQKVFTEANVDTEVIQLGNKPIRDCIQCGYCFEHGECVFKDDDVNAFVEKAKDADGFIFAKLALAHEFSGKMNTTYSAPGNPTVQTTVDLKDTWLDAEIGGSWSVRPSTYLYGTFTKNFGATIDNTWRIDAGVRHNF